MKKILCILLAAVMMLGFVGCGSSKKEAETTTAPAVAKADIVFKEATYVTLINDVYNNPNNYLGKVIQIDGMFTSEDFTSQGGKIYYYVYRQGPGCCGNDGSMCGFEFTSADGTYPDYVPKEGDAPAAHPWIKVVGTLEQYYEDQNGQQTGPFYTLKNATYEVMTTRGAEVVSL
ncbi:MAG: hypothetical protein IJJ41_01405 [Clostridia bacterium]|nr:hypothetical protein [Clostridia bacterium]